MLKSKKRALSVFPFFTCLLPICFCSFLSGNHFWNECKQRVFEELPRVPGWCSAEKAEKLMDFVFEFQPEICVEIGTFGGSTTYPLASALEFLGQGKLYAIDAWENHAAIEGLEENDPNLEWWKNLDLVGIRQRFFQFLILKKLRAWCHPIALLSQEAVSSFADESIDLLYIDGNFSEEGSLRDVLFYFPKVKKGGFIWLNDANVATKKKSVIFLMDNSQWLKKWSLKNSCIVFQK